MLAKSSIAAAVMAAALAFMPEAASAKTKIHIGIGGNWCHFHPYSAGCRYGYGYYPRGYGYYHPPIGYYHAPYYYPTPRYRSVVSCSTARQIVRNHGFNNVRARDCSGRTYSFIARKSGKSWLVSVNARNSRITGVQRL